MSDDFLLRNILSRIDDLETKIKRIESNTETVNKNIGTVINLLNTLSRSIRVEKTD